MSTYIRSESVAEFIFMKHFYPLYPFLQSHIFTLDNKRINIFMVMYRDGKVGFLMILTMKTETWKMEIYEVYSQKMFYDKNWTITSFSSTRSEMIAVKVSIGKSELTKIVSI